MPVFIKLSTSKIKRYIEESARRCPFCGCTEMDQDLVDADDGGDVCVYPGGVFINTSCDHCNREWREVYKLITIVQDSSVEDTPTLPEDADAAGAVLVVEDEQRLDPSSADPLLVPPPPPPPPPQGVLDGANEPLVHRTGDLTVPDGCPRPFLGGTRVLCVRGINSGYIGIASGDSDCQGWPAIQYVHWDGATSATPHDIQDLIRISQGDEAEYNRVQVAVRANMRTGTLIHAGAQRAMDAHVDEDGDEVQHVGSPHPVGFREGTPVQVHGAVLDGCRGVVVSTEFMAGDVPVNDRVVFLPGFRAALLVFGIHEIHRVTEQTAGETLRYFPIGAYVTSRETLACGHVVGLPDDLTERRREIRFDNALIDPETNQLYTSWHDIIELGMISNLPHHPSPLVSSPPGEQRAETDHE